MPTSKPPKPDNTNQELTQRRIAEFAVEESRLSNVAYRFQLVPRDRVWKNWDRTEFEQNHYQVMGLAGVCLTRDEVENVSRRRVAPVQAMAVPHRAGDRHSTYEPRIAARRRRSSRGRRFSRSVRRRPCG